MRRAEPAIVGIGVDCLVESEVAAVVSDNTHVDRKASPLGRAPSTSECKDAAANSFRY